MAHYREKSPYCDTCRAFRTAYTRKRRENPDRKSRDNRSNAARSRALWRLAALHPEDFERLYLEEIGPPLLIEDHPKETA
jgi:hypothetical protein